LLKAFFELLPRDAKGAVQLARKHNDSLKKRAWLKVEDERQLIRHALEVRHASFEDPAFVKLMREHQIGVVIADTAGKWPQFDEVTADFVYCRLHGDEQLYVSGYTDSGLDEWARKIRDWTRRKRDVFVYFDNDVKVRAPYDAMRLSSKLGLRHAPADNFDAARIREQPRRHWPAVKAPRRRNPRHA